MKSTKCPWRCGDGYVSVWRAMRLLPFLVILSGLSGLANSVRLVGESEIGNGNNATVTWLTEESDSEPYIGSNEKDEVRLYCSDENPLDSSTLRDDHIDHWHIPDILIQSESNLPYNGTVAFGPLINMRVTCQIIFWKYNSTGQDQHLPLFPSNAHKLTVGRGPLQPMQAHLSLTADPSVVYLTWVSSYVSNYNPSVWYHESAQPGAVSTSQAGATTYAAGDMCGAKAVRVEGQHFRDPGAIYSAALANLKPATNYSYWFGIDKANTGGMSPVHWFLSPKLSASNAHIVATADMGAWGGSNPKVDEWQSPIPTIMQRILTVSDAKPVDLVAIYGDLSYANGEGHVWERYFYRLEPVATRIPLHVAIGNHEYDYDRLPAHSQHRDPSGVVTAYQPSWGNLNGDSSQGECAVPVATRFRMPVSPGSNGVFWYSHNVANVHMVVISTEHDVSPGSVQAKWLESDLAAVNRTRQPWVIVGGHRSLYNNVQYTHPDPDLPYQEHGRRYLTPLFDQYNVNVYLAGHYHNYVRTCPLIVAGTCVAVGGTTHITVGTGGAGLEPDTFSTPSWIAFNLTGYHGFVTFETASSTMAVLKFFDAVSGQMMDNTTLIQNIDHPSSRPSPETSTRPTTCPASASPRPSNGGTSPIGKEILIGTLCALAGFMLGGVSAVFILKKLKKHRYGTVSEF